MMTNMGYSELVWVAIGMLFGLIIGMVVMRWATIRWMQQVAVDRKLGNWIVSSQGVKQFAWSYELADKSGEKARREMGKEAVEHGVAYWDIDRETGERCFMWGRCGEDEQVKKSAQGDDDKLGDI